MGGMSFKCPKCDKWYLTKQELKDHLKIKHETAKIKINGIGSYVELLPTTTKIRNIPCPHCTKHFSTENDLSQHKRYKHPTAPNKTNSPKHSRGKERNINVELFSEMFDDLPDGAFFAMVEEWGIDPTDFIEEN